MSYLLYVYPIAPAVLSAKPQSVRLKDNKYDQEAQAGKLEDSIPEQETDHTPNQRYMNMERHDSTAR